MRRERLQWQLHLLCITKQWCLASLAVPVSSISIPGCGLPPSYPLILSPHSQRQSSPRVCSPIPMFQLPALMHTGRCMFQSGAGQAVAQTNFLGHTVLSAKDQLFHPPPTASDSPLLSQLISLPVRGLPWMREPLLFLSSPQACRSHPASSPLLFPFFFLSSYLVM